MPIWEDLEWTGISWSRPRMSERIMLIGDSITNGYSALSIKHLKMNIRLESIHHQRQLTIYT